MYVGVFAGLSGLDRVRALGFNLKGARFSWGSPGWAVKIWHGALLELWRTLWQPGDVLKLLAPF